MLFLIATLLMPLQSDKPDDPPKGALIGPVKIFSPFLFSFVTPPKGGPAFDYRLNLLVSCRP
jgi:hypothetical protein